jgi:hypothetical protein
LIEKVWEDKGNIEMAEEYDLQTDELLVRKLRKPSVLGADGPWVYEIGFDCCSLLQIFLGEPPLRRTDDLGINESANSVWVMYFL